MADTKENLGRRLASANEHLRAAQRDGKYVDIAMWLKTRDDLLDQLYPPKQTLQLALEDSN